MLMCMFKMLIILLVVVSLIGGIVGFDVKICGKMGFWMMVYFGIIIMLVVVFGIIMVVIICLGFNGD